MSRIAWEGRGSELVEANSRLSEGLLSKQALRLFLSILYNPLNMAFHDVLRTKPSRRAQNTTVTDCGRNQYIGVKDRKINSCKLM